MFFRRLWRKITGTVEALSKKTEAWDDVTFSIYTYVATLIICLLITIGSATYFIIENRKVHAEFKKYQAHNLNVMNQWHMCVVQYSSIVDRYETIISIVE